MVRGFANYIVEVMGTDSMERDPADIIMSPATDRASAMMFYAGSSGSIPAHWNNSPFLSGGRLTSAFGLNPKKIKKKNVLSYHDFRKAAKHFSK